MPEFKSRVQVPALTDDILDLAVEIEDEIRGGEDTTPFFAERKPTTPISDTYRAMNSQVIKSFISKPKPVTPQWGRTLPKQVTPKVSKSVNALAATSITDSTILIPPRKKTPPKIYDTFLNVVQSSAVHSGIHNRR